MVYVETRARQRALTIHLLLPVRGLDGAKERLAPILGPDERAALVLAMLRDVLAAARAAELAASVLSPDARVLDFAERAGASPLAEQPPDGGLNQALESAIRREFRAADSLLILLPDVPLVEASDLRELVTRGQGGASAAPGGSHVLLCPDRGERGTNGLLLQPSDAIRPLFGGDSFEAHRAEALARAVPFEVRRLPRVALDLDTADDVRAFMAIEGRTSSHALLRSFGVGERLQAPGTAPFPPTP